eukprot:1011767_1
MKKSKISILLLFVAFFGGYAFAKSNDCTIEKLNGGLTEIFGATAIWQLGGKSTFGENYKIHGTCGADSQIALTAECNSHWRHGHLLWYFKEARKCNPDATCKLDMTDSLHMTLTKCDFPTEGGKATIDTWCNIKCSQ